MFDPIDITITDPRNFDGSPYEVADRAIAQVEGVLAAAQTALEGAFLMARNADMERNLAMQLPPGGSEYAGGPQGRAFTQVQERLKLASAGLPSLRKAVAYDPKHPPKVG